MKNLDQYRLQSCTWPGSQETGDSPSPPESHHCSKAVDERDLNYSGPKSGRSCVFTVSIFSSLV